MKKIIVIVLALMSYPIVSLAQEETSAPKEEKTKSEAVQFMEKDGTLMLKEFYPEVNIGGVTFQVATLKDVVSDTKIGCLRVSTMYYSKYSTDTYTGVLDYDEITACIQSLKYIKSIVETTPGNYTECEFKSRDGVKLGAYYDSNSWVLYVKPKSYNSRSTKSFKVSLLDQLISALENSQELIKVQCNN